MTDFLQTELDEIDAVRAALGEKVLNKWFDKSPIKDRFKKARIKDQMLRCCYCRRSNATVYANEWDLEHILCEEIHPQFFTAAGNLAIACKRCNLAKSNADVYAASRPHLPLLSLPAHSRMYSIPHPRLDQWTEHLSHVNYQIYTSKTPKGLELMEICKLNDAAIKDAQLSREQVVAAVRTKFFEEMGNIVDNRVSDDVMIVAITGIREKMEDIQAGDLIVGLDRKLQKLGQRAAGRTTAQAVAEAKAIAEQRSLRLLAIE